jgi:hypothetical protein
MTLSVQMVRFSLSLSVAIFFSHKFSEITIGRGNACLKSELVVESWEVLSLSLSLSLRWGGASSSLWQTFSEPLLQIYKEDDRWIYLSIDRSIDRWSSCCC